MPSPGSKSAWIAQVKAALEPAVTTISLRGSARIPLSRASFLAIA
jgi:hypothetical protein